MLTRMLDGKDSGEIKRGLHRNFVSGKEKARSWRVGLHGLPLSEYSS
jgi:hypothetical protein